MPLLFLEIKEKPEMQEEPEISTQVNLANNTTEPAMTLPDPFRVNLATGDIELGIRIGDNMWLPF